MHYSCVLTWDISSNSVLLQPSSLVWGERWFGMCGLTCDLPRQQSSVSKGSDAEWSSDCEQGHTQPDRVMETVGGIHTDLKKSISALSWSVAQDPTDND